MREDSPTRPRRRRLCFALAALAYLAIVLWILSAPLSDPSRMLPTADGLKPAISRLDQLDQSMVIYVIMRNAQLMTSEPWKLFDDGQCHPFPHSYTLGEHMFGEGILAAVPWRLTEDPILSYNLLLVVARWLPGVTMYALSHHFTRSAPAAFVAGLLFLLVPSRIRNASHPFLCADYFIPLVLLFLHKLFAGQRRWLAAIGLAFFLALQALETIYVLLMAAVLVGTYGVYELFRHRDRFGQVVVPLVVATLVPLGVAWIVLSPYLETAATWGVLQGRVPLLLPPADYLPGQPAFPGAVALVLALVALVDRLYRRRLVGGEDPRWALFVAGLLIVWTATSGLPLPGTGLRIPGLLEVLSDTVPGVDSVRALFIVAGGVWVPLAFLAGYGVLAIVERMKPRAAIVTVAALSFLLFAERMFRPLALWNFGYDPSLIAWAAAPPTAQVELLRNVGRGAVLHLPVPRASNHLKWTAGGRKLLAQSYDPRPTSLCYNSFQSPTLDQLHQLASALPDASAGQALAALGFGSAISHGADWGPAGLARFRRDWSNDPAAQEVLVAAYEEGADQGFYLQGKAPLGSDESLLVGDAAATTPFRLTPTATTLPMVFSNQSDFTYRRPPPIRPTPVEVRWFSGDTEMNERKIEEVLLPLAIGPGGKMTVPLPVRVPAKLGRYRVEMWSTDSPPRLLASRRVIVQRES